VAGRRGSQAFDGSCRNEHFHAVIAEDEDLLLWLS